MVNEFRRPLSSDPFRADMMERMKANTVSDVRQDPPQIGAVSSIDRAMAPKTEGANVDGQDPSTGYQKRH